MPSVPYWIGFARRLELISILFQRDPHQLAACVHSGLGEELLQRSFDRTFRDANLLGDLLVGEALKYEREDLPFTLRKTRLRARIRVAGDRYL